MPCVPGSATRRRTLPNFPGSSLMTPDAACPASPTPMAEPMPARMTARAAPDIANNNPRVIFA